MRHSLNASRGKKHVNNVSTWRHIRRVDILFLFLPPSLLLHLYTPSHFACNMTQEHIKRHENCVCMSSPLLSAWPPPVCAPTMCVGCPFPSPFCMQGLHPASMCKWGVMQQSWNWRSPPLHLGHLSEQKTFFFHEWLSSSSERCSIISLASWQTSIPQLKAMCLAIFSLASFNLLSWHPLSVYLAEIVCQFECQY